MRFSENSNIEPHPASAEVRQHKVPAGPPDRHEPPEEDKLFDTAQLRQSFAFVVEALRSHKVTAVTTFVIVFGVIATIANLWPKTYEVDGRLLMQRNEVTASLVNPGRTIPREAESPTLAAREIVLGRENVLALMKATNLLEEWERTRSPLLRFKDWVLGVFRSEPTEDERIDALAGLVEERLQVGTSDEGAVSFFIRWPDPQMAFRLVDEAMKSFLEYRRINETAAITESITILDRSAKALETQITETVAQLPKRPAERPATRRPTTTVRGPSPQSMVQLSRLKTELDARQQEIDRMAAARNQQLTEARTRLTTARTIYTEDHPTVLTLRQTVEQLSRDSPELAAARREVRELEEQYDSLSIRVGVANQAAQSGASTASGAPAMVPFSLSGLGDESDPVSLRLRVEIAQLASVRERANAARAELASAQAGFKYRYSVTRPARVPRRPSGPNVAAITLVGALAALVLAVGVPVARRISGL